MTDETAIYVRVKDADSSEWDLIFRNPERATIEQIDAAVRRAKMIEHYEWPDLARELNTLGLVRVHVIDATERW